MADSFVQYQHQLATSLGWDNDLKSFHELVH